MQQSNEPPALLDCWTTGQESRVGGGGRCPTLCPGGRDVGWSLDLTLHLMPGTQRPLSKWVKYPPGILSPEAVDPNSGPSLWASWAQNWKL